MKTEEVRETSNDGAAGPNLSPIPNKRKMCYLISALMLFHNDSNWTKLKTDKEKDVKAIKDCCARTDNSHTDITEKIS